MDTDGEGARVGGGVAVSGRRQLESVLLGPRSLPPVFCSHSAKFGHECPPAAHTSGGTKVGHTPFMDPRPVGARAAPWNRHFVLASNDHGSDFFFSGNFPPQTCCSVYVLGSLGDIAPKMSGCRAWKSR